MRVIKYAILRNHPGRIRITFGAEDGKLRPERDLFGAGLLSWLKAQRLLECLGGIGVRPEMRPLLDKGLERFASFGSDIDWYELQFVELFNRASPSSSLLEI